MLTPSEHSCPMRKTHAAMARGKLAAVTLLELNIWSSALKCAEQADLVVQRFRKPWGTCTHVQRMVNMHLSGLDLLQRIIKCIISVLQCDNSEKITNQIAWVTVTLQHILLKDEAVRC